MKKATMYRRALLLLLVTAPVFAQHHTSNWLYRNAADTTLVPCWTDSMTKIFVPPASMSMMMPSSMYMRIDKMTMDSLMIAHDSTFIGWYKMEAGSDSMNFNMMNEGGMNGGSVMMQFMMSLSCRFHWDSLMADSAHRHWHPTGMKGWNGSSWTSMTGSSVSGSAVSFQSNQSFSAIAFVGTSSVTGVTGQNVLPAKFALMQNYPNPFNPSTNIEYRLPQTSGVRLDVYNILGEKVATLVNGVQQAGVHTVNLDGSSMPSGVYFYRLQTGQFVATSKMTLLK